MSYFRRPVTGSTFSQIIQLSESLSTRDGTWYLVPRPSIDPATPHHLVIDVQFAVKCNWVDEVTDIVDQFASVIHELVEIIHHPILTVKKDPTSVS